MDRESAFSIASERLTLEEYIDFLKRTDRVPSTPGSASRRASPGSSRTRPSASRRETARDSWWARCWD